MRSYRPVLRGIKLLSSRSKSSEGGGRRTIKVGIDQHGLNPLQLTPMALLQWAVDHGAEGVQFSGFDSDWQRRMEVPYLKDLRAFAESKRLYLEWGGAEHIPRDMTTWAHRDLFASNQLVAAQAERLGSGVVRSCSGGLMRWNDAAPSTETLLRDTASALMAQRDMLRDHGVVLAIELHFEFTTHELLRLFEMCEAIPGDWLGVVFDTMNVLTMLEDPVRATDRILPWVVATHIKDGGIRVVPDGLETFPTAVGDGVIALVSVIRRLASSGRQVHLSVEDHGGTFHLQTKAPEFLAKFPDVTDDEMADLEALAMRATRSAKCIPTERALWPEICEERMGRNLTRLKALVAELEVA